jgi:hypothetical protein
MKCLDWQRSNQVIVKTFSGSVYEIDRPNKRIRRLSGETPAKHPQDHDWRKFLEAYPNNIEVGSSILILWDTGSRMDVPTTRTSYVIQVGN